MISTEIEITASPAKVREVFLDFPKFPEWTNGFIKYIEVINKVHSKDDSNGDGAGMDLEKGDTVKAEVGGLTVKPTVQVNSPTEFRWRGTTLLGALVGEHIFRLEPSEANPGGTRFVQAEEFFRFMGVLMKAPPVAKQTEKGFEGFNRDLKARVEGLQGSS